MHTPEYAGSESQRLLLITTQFPHRTEFLEDEIHVLSRAYEQIEIAPIAPRGPIRVPLPPNVNVSYGLARQWAGRSSVSRRLTRPVGNALRSRLLRHCRPHQRLQHWQERLKYLQIALVNAAEAGAHYAWASGATEPAVVYSYWLGSGSIGLRRAWPSVPLVSRAHGGEIFAQQHGVSETPLLEHMLAACTIVASVSQSGLEHLSALHPRASDRLRVSRVGIRDLGQLNPMPSQYELKLLSVSTVDENKRVHAIARVAQALATTTPETRVHWDHFGDGPELPRLDRECREGRNPRNLSVSLHGHVDNDLVRRHLQQQPTSVFINLSESEGTPVSLMEAQCVGIPCVATHVGGSVEVLTPDLDATVAIDTPASQTAATVMDLVRRDSASNREARRRNWREHFETNQASGTLLDLLGQAREAQRRGCGRQRRDAVQVGGSDRKPDSTNRPDSALEAAVGPESDEAPLPAEACPWRACSS